MASPRIFQSSALHRSLIAGWIIVRLLPERYYQIKSFESSGRVYERLGIRFFKRFVPNGDYINRRIRHSEPVYRVICDENSIVKFEAGTRLAERCHIVSLLLMLPSAAYALMLGWNNFALWILLPNIPLHLYPVLLQRYTRARIQKVLNRGKRKR
jgi:Glycosyl-4,4'-diaponeurosporenoate acyltransferase